MDEGSRACWQRSEKVGRDVEPPQSLKFSVSSLKQEPGLKLEILKLGTPQRLVRPLAPPIEPATSNAPLRTLP